MESLVVRPEFWSGKRVFLTGHTGFKGSWLTLWLNQLGAKVTGYSLEPPTVPSLYNQAGVAEVAEKNIHADIRDLTTLSQAIKQAQPDIVIHMAAQSLVRESYKHPVETYATNVMGTVNVFEAVRPVSSVKAILNITTDKCYENREWVWGYRENDPMGGFDPYSSSKGCAELVSSAYRRSFFIENGVALATARAGNVIGGGDWAVDRIVPDAVRAFSRGDPLVVRNPLAVRPWQHVLDPLYGYLLLCQQLVLSPDKYTDAWNFGPSTKDIQPVSRLVDIMVGFWSEGSSWQHDKTTQPHEAQELRLDCTKANTILNWYQSWDLSRTLRETVDWYKADIEGADMAEISKKQISLYQYERLNNE
jgi:CDP-glucose 4,6-dehydratase